MENIPYNNNDLIEKCKRVQQNILEINAMFTTTSQFFEQQSDLKSIESTRNMESTRNIENTRNNEQLKMLEKFNEDVSNIIVYLQADKKNQNEDIARLRERVDKLDHLIQQNKVVQHTIDESLLFDTEFITPSERLFTTPLSKLDSSTIPASLPPSQETVIHDETDLSFLLNI